MTSNNLALELSRKHKRLLYWKDTFATAHISEDSRQIIQEKLNTYCLLSSRFAKTLNETDRQETELRIAALERELTALFEARRQATTSIGSLK